MKKCLKNIPEERAAKEDTPEGLTTAETNSGTRGKKALITLTAEQRAFVKTLNDEMKKFNKFFMNAEEDLVMRERALGEKLHALVDKQSGKLVCVNDYDSPTSSVTALKETRKAFADFHGELVLLEHWTSLNYTALVKILKKHDKRSRVRLRSPFLVSALLQPFYSTEVLTELIKKTEVRFRKLHELTSEAEAAGRLNGELTAEKTASLETRTKTRTKTPPALARTRAAISCWDGMKDEDSVKRPFGDGHTGFLKAAEPASKKMKA